MTESTLTPEIRRSLAYRFWALWVSFWGACCDPFDINFQGDDA